MATVVWERGYEKWGVDDIIAALEYNDRICGIYLWPSGKLSTSQMGQILAEMQQPFLVLRDMELVGGDETAPLDFASFLSGSARCLQNLYLTRIALPRLPKLLLSATHLVCLTLWNIPHSGYFSPEAMVTCLSVLTRLEKLSNSMSEELLRNQCRSNGPRGVSRFRGRVAGSAESVCLQHCRVGQTFSYDHELSWELIN